ncbi:retron Ec67 family RNA-directed DNA polymerase/endonuclease [Shewanella sp. SM23]|uniref:retron Ec67 family RNA-directed DNA polymerase/endonuclease n=1 Tax=Shewanella sp. SM23 TaxID=2912794 RepID=UPI0021DA161F|nr:retron Ec67 family RNA-directed DNA polymerase/endonuclease [Shewanella sp. SM23]MCU8085437.1 retron Ec67 family RNA-directed DNA polymerase/endonuclease [Shewanella sp. SM23]
MDAITKLQGCTTRSDLAYLLNYRPSHFAYLLYKTTPEQKYSQFNIAKKSGGERVINAPTEKLKQLQRNLSDLLLDCIDDINKSKSKKSTLAHGFVRDKSIITNAEMHKNKNNVLNIDLEDFFGSFNFGRVSGFFIRNRNFLLNEVVATTIAQICCHNDELPQGSPCSPVITNLIAHSLDIRLASLAKKYSCTYTRYADDITFSTRKNSFPVEIMAQDEGEYIPGRRLIGEIVRSGFRLNHNKTRIQFKDSRQDVTGLIVNNKIGIKREYRQLTKSMCNSLFQTGKYTKIVNGEHVEGSINELEGRLNFIDSVDFYNRINHPEVLSILYAHRNHGYKTRALLSSREKLLSKFLFYKNFYNADKPTILCEGKTDNIYLLSALNILSPDYKLLASAATKTKKFEPKVQFFNYSKRTRFLLELYGGTSYLSGFIASYQHHFLLYKAPNPKCPVVIVLDNDAGLKDIIKELCKIKSCTFSPRKAKGVDVGEAIKTTDFVHVCNNLYLVITPLDGDKDTMIEHSFEKHLWATKINNRVFDPTEKIEPKSNYYGKNVFATEVVKLNKNKINFDGFKPLFDRITKVIAHYAKNKDV